VAPYQNPEKRDSHDSIKVLFGLNSKAEIYLPVGRRCPKGLDYYTDGLASKRISTRIQDFMLPVGLRFLLEWGWIKPRLTSESQRVRESESQRVREYCTLQYLLGLGRLGRKKRNVTEVPCPRSVFLLFGTSVFSFCAGKVKAVTLRCVCLCAVAPPVSSSR
jgi:hypothetical protein